MIVPPVFGPTMRRIAIVCGLLLMMSALVAAFASGQDRGVAYTRSPPGPHPWALKPGVKITPASRSVTITYSEGGPCFQDEGVDVQETADAVTITKFSSTIGGFDGTYYVAISCPTPGPTERIVGLDAPLGSRVILDGSSTPPVQRYPGAGAAKPDSISDAYARLHRRGLPISFRRAFALDSESRYATYVTGVRRVRRHGRKVLKVRLGQRAVPLPQDQPVVTTPDLMPNFVGRPLSAAVTWADTRGVRWTAGTPPRIVASKRPTLLGNYAVVKQRPTTATPVSAQSQLLQFTVRIR